MVQTNLVTQQTLLLKIAVEIPPEFKLIGVVQSENGRLQDRPHSSGGDGNKSVIVDKGKEAHDELTVHTVSDAAMAGNRITEILDLECALEARGEKAAKGGNEGRKGRQDKRVKLHRGRGDAEAGARREEKEFRRLISVRQEDRVHAAIQATEKSGSEIGSRAKEVFEAQENVGQKDAKDGRHHPGPDKPLNCFLRRELDELGPAKGNAADIGEDVIRNNQSGGEEEPDETFKHIVHDEVGLANDEKQCYVSPSEL